MRVSPRPANKPVSKKLSAVEGTAADRLSAVEEDKAWKEPEDPGTPEQLHMSALSPIFRKLHGPV